MGVSKIEKSVDQMDPSEICLYIDRMTPKGGLFADVKRVINSESNSSWRVSPEPWGLPEEMVQQLEALGKHLFRFYRAVNLLYSQSIRKIQPAWVSGYLDQGKSEEVISFGRMNRFKRDLPRVIRPDLIPTRNGLVATELDSIPGGIGFTASLCERYGKLGYELVGGASGMVSGFMEMVRSVSGSKNPVLVVLISEESSAWKLEMSWLGELMNRSGLETYVVTPEEIFFKEKGIFVKGKGGKRRVDVLYRFFELFDLRNIPKMDLVLYAVRKGLVKLTPPLKGFLEEKMTMGLFHHPMLKQFWLRELGEESFEFLGLIFPKTWILDPRPLPPHSVISGLEIEGEAVSEWTVLGSLGQRSRKFVVKPSGYSELAWGSRGVSVGHDLSEKDWQSAIELALEAFPFTPHILQEFHTGAGFKVVYFDFETHKMKQFRGRIRLQPYYFVVGNEITLSGVQATICPDDKKVLHGMVDAVVVPCGIREKNGELRRVVKRKDGGGKK